MFENICGVGERFSQKMSFEDTVRPIEFSSVQKRFLKDAHMFYILPNANAIALAFSMAMLVASLQQISVPSIQMYSKTLTRSKYKNNSIDHRANKTIKALNISPKKRNSHLLRHPGLKLWLCGQHFESLHQQLLGPQTFEHTLQLCTLLFPVAFQQPSPPVLYI